MAIRSSWQGLSSAQVSCSSPAWSPVAVQHGVPQGQVDGLDFPALVIEPDQVAGRARYVLNRRFGATWPIRFLRRSLAGNPGMFSRSKYQRANFRYLS
jgi:hypothetical protein